MENFFKIRAEKQNHIINAAFLVFGRQGYRKASLSDIAQEAGITKGLITYYFGSKMTLYLHLVDVCKAWLLQGIKDKFTNGSNDFFERIRMTLDLQVKAIKEHPALIRFVDRLYYETDPQIKNEVAKHFDAEVERFSQALLTGADMSKFKPGFDPMLIIKLIFWANDGFIAELYEFDAIDKVDALAGQFYQCLYLLQQTFCET